MFGKYNNQKIVEFIDSTRKVFFLRKIYIICAKNKNLIVYFTILFLIGFLFYLGNKNLGYNWQLQQIPKFFAFKTENGWQLGVLSKGLKLTLLISIIALCLSIVIGSVFAILSLSQSFSGKILAKFYVGLIRNTPLLIQLFIFYYILSPIFYLDRLWSGILCLSFFEGAYTAEIIRGGIQSIPKNQWESGYSIGLKKLFVLRKIILPQTVKIILPPLTSQLINLIKNSAIVSVIAILDLVAEGRNLIADTFLSFEVWFTIAFIYFIINISLSFFIQYLKKIFWNFS